MDQKTFYPPALPLYTEKPMVMVDCDDTLHDAEDHIMARTWNALLAPWGVVWKQFEDSDPEARYITDEERPGVGIRPLEVVKHFINNIGLDMSPLTANEELILKLGVSKKDFDKMKEDWTLLPSEDRLDRWARLLETSRNSLGVEIVKKYGVREIPGAVDLLRRIHDAGFSIGVVTSGSLPYAREVLNQLGLVHYNEDGSFSGADHDMVAAGDMVQKPKPDPESHNLTVQLMRGLRRVNPTTIAMFGDSGSDANFALNTGIPRVYIRRSEHLSQAKEQLLADNLGSRIVFLNDWNDFDVERLHEITASIEGPRFPVPERR